MCVFFKFFISLHQMVILHCSFASPVFVFKSGYNKTILFPLYPVPTYCTDKLGAPQILKLCTFYLHKAVNTSSGSRSDFAREHRNSNRGRHRVLCFLKKKYTDKCTKTPHDSRIHIFYTSLSFKKHIKKRFLV